MEDYIEDYRYDNCFWKKSNVLYTHSEYKFQEFLSIGEMCKIFSENIKTFYNGLNTLTDIYKPCDEGSTRNKGIEVFINIINKIIANLKEYSNMLDVIFKKIKEKKLSYDSKMEIKTICDNILNEYETNLKSLQNEKTSYDDTINKTIELFLTLKSKNKDTKKSNELKKSINNVLIKKKEYLNKVEECEKLRTDYMEVQGNIFAAQEEFERECTDELKNYLTQIVNGLKNSMNKTGPFSTGLKIIQNINGLTDSVAFAEKNKSLMTGPKRNLFIEYSQNMQYYCENFEVVKNKLKNKSQEEIRKIQTQLASDIKNFLSEFIKKKKEETIQKIEKIGINLLNEKISDKDCEYLINLFDEQYNEFIEWKKKKVRNQNYKKVGENWDNRFYYMQTFIILLNNHRADSPKLNNESYEYLSKIICKILSLNDNEDIDYSLCDLIVILSSTYYKMENDEKKYLTDKIKKCPIMQRQGFWVGLTKYQLNEEIQHQNKIEDTLKEEGISEEKINNCIISKIMSITFNIIQFVTDSKTFNRIIYDIFKYCQINEETRETAIEMIDAQLETENNKNFNVDKEFLRNYDKKKSINEKEIDEDKISENDELSFGSGSNNKNGSICTEDNNLNSYLSVNSDFNLWK